MSDLLRELLTAIDDGEAVVLATVVASCDSVPRHAGSKLLVYGYGRRSGSIGGGHVEERVAADAAAVLADGQPRLVRYDLDGACGGQVTVYLEPHLPPPAVLVVGCGHVGRAVAELAHWAGFRVLAVDSRAEMVTAELLPGAALRLAGPVADVLPQVPVTADTHVVLATSDVAADVAALEPLLATPVRSVAVLGSRRRWQLTRAELAARGVADDALDRVSAPAGLDIGATTPREIALSIVAGIVAARPRAEAPA